MSTDRWRRLNDLFHEALRLPPEQRAAYLESECAGDETLRAELDELLAANVRAEGFLDGDALGNVEPDEDLDTPPAIGRRFGPYRAIAELGRRGMGTVLLAVRDDGQFEQQVAVKIIKRGMDTAGVLERFRVERQILSTLNHPNIARLLDGGTTAEGLPYFVMEHIDGLPVDQYADEKRLTIRQRIELFLQVCDAVSCAHQHLIVHRDIKPQNILVTPDGVPTLLDFGIAKVLQDSGEQGTMTIAGRQLLTWTSSWRGRPSATIHDSRRSSNG